MTVSPTIIKRLRTDRKFKRDLQNILGIVDNAIKYRIENNVRLDTYECIQYFKENGYSEKEIFDLETASICRKVVDDAIDKSSKLD